MKEFKIRKYIRRLFPKLLLASFSIVFPLVVVDLVAYHILEIRMPGLQSERFFQFSPLLGWDMIPNSSGYLYNYNDGSRFFVEINSHGFADSERTLQKTRPRIALLGDSITQFWEAEKPYRGQYVIEDILNGNYEVLNFGVRGYGTDQALILFENRVAQFSPEIIVYTLCINDFRNNTISKYNKPFFELDPNSPNGLVLTGYPIEFMSPKNWRVSRFRDYSLVFRKYKDFEKQLNNFLGSLFGDGEEPVSRHAPLEDHFLIRPFLRQYSEEDRRREEITLKLLAKLNQSINERGMKLLIVEGVYQPANEEAGRQKIEQIYGDRFDFFRVTDTLEIFARENGIAFLSLPRLVKERGILVSDLMHPEDQVHFDKRGIQFFSQAVVEKLYSLQWVDSPTSCSR